MYIAHVSTAKPSEVVFEASISGDFTVPVSNIDTKPAPPARVIGFAGASELPPFPSARKPPRDFVAPLHLASTTPASPQPLNLFRDEREVHLHTTSVHHFARTEVEEAAKPGLWLLAFMISSIVILVVHISSAMSTPSKPATVHDSWTRELELPTLTNTKWSVRIALLAATLASLSISFLAGMPLMPWLIALVTLPLLGEVLVRDINLSRQATWKRELNALHVVTLDALPETEPIAHPMPPPSPPEVLEIMHVLV